MGSIRKCRRYAIDLFGYGLLGGVRRSSALASSVLLDLLGRRKLVGMSGTCEN